MLDRCVTEADGPMWHLTIEEGHEELKVSLVAAHTLEHGLCAEDPRCDHANPVVESIWSGQLRSQKRLFVKHECRDKAGLNSLVLLWKVLCSVEELNQSMSTVHADLDLLRVTLNRLRIVGSGYICWEGRSEGWD